MALETATYIDALIVTNPDGADARNTSDDHIRLIKAALRRTFPNIAGEVSASHGALNYLSGVNQNIQVQFNNLREGTATARNALVTRFAHSASHASFAASAAYALTSATPFPTVFSVSTSDLTLSANTATTSFVEATLSASGYWYGSGMLLGYVQNTALSATLELLAGANYNPNLAGQTLLAVGGIPMDQGEATSLEPRLVLKSRITAQSLKFPGPAAGTVNFAVSFDMVANVSQSAVPVIASLLTGFTLHNAGQQVVFKRGSYIHLERVGSSV